MSVTLHNTAVTRGAKVTAYDFIRHVVNERSFDAITSRNRNDGHNGDDDAELTVSVLSGSGLWK